jgi:hypothetical protein
MGAAEQYSSMTKKLPSFSESTWIGAFVAVVGAVGSIIGLAYIFAPQPIISLGIGAGFGWALVIALFVVNGILRNRIAQLEADVAEAKERADNWSYAAADASAASRAVAELFKPQALPPTPRRRKNPRNP